MKFSCFALAAAVAVALPTAALADEPFGITKSECASQGGVVESDMTCDVYSPQYECSNTGRAATSLVRPDDGQDWPEECEVCCGGTGNREDLSFFDNTPSPSELEEWFKMTPAECTEWDGVVVQDSGDGAVFSEHYICASDGFPPVGNVHNDFSAAPIGVCCLEPWVMTPAECTDYTGTVVADSGDGAVFAAGYICESDGYPPLGQVAATEGGTPTGVCCLPPFDEDDFDWSMTKSLKPMSKVKQANARAHKKAHSGNLRK